MVTLLRQIEEVLSARGFLYRKKKLKEEIGGRKSKKELSKGKKRNIVKVTYIKL